MPRSIVYRGQRSPAPTRAKAIEKTPAMVAQERAWGVLGDYINRLRTLQTAGYTWTEGSLRHAQLNAQNLNVQWKQVRAEVSAHAYGEEAVIVPFMIYTRQVDSLTIAIQAWVDFLSQLLNSLLAGYSQPVAEQSASGSANAASTGTTTGTSLTSGILSTPMIMVAVGLVIVLMLRK